jgi:hypothetical protein
VLPEYVGGNAMITFWAAFAAVGVAVAFFAGMAFIVYLENRRKMQDRDLAHAERMKALELGLPLPDADIARASAEVSRARAAGAVAILVTLTATGAGLGATALFREYSGNWYGELLAGIWVGCGVVALVAVILSLVALRNRRARTAVTGQPFPVGPVHPEHRTAVTAERTTDM